MERASGELALAGNNTTGAIHAEKKGKKKFALLISDSLMDWFRGDDELCPRIDANLSCESFSEHYIHVALYIALSFIKRDSKLELIAHRVSIS